MTTAEIAVVIPTFKRPTKLAPLVESLSSATKAPCKLYFVIERSDGPTIERVRELGVDFIFNEGPGSYASCVNTAYRRTAEPFLFLGADDIRFGEKCFEAALAAVTDQSVGILGSYDPTHPDKDDHADHYLVRRRYIDEQGGSMDERGFVLYSYQHAFTDLEIIQVAKVRGVYAFSSDFVIYHDHPGWVADGQVDQASPRFDEVYEKGNQSNAEDLRIYALRSRRWRRQLLAQPNASSLDRSLLHLARLNDPRAAALLLDEGRASADRVRARRKSRLWSKAALRKLRALKKR